MQAAIQTGYGSPDVFELREINQPIPKENEVLVRVHAAAINAGDLFGMRGVPYSVRLALGWPKPKKYVPGYDVAGLVEAVGEHVTQIQPGDEVFGATDHTCAEYVCAAEDKLMPRPTNLMLAQVAAIPTAAVAALRGLHNAGKVQPGQKVLINGASGGVGTFAVQIAKALGAEVTGVCSTRNVEMVHALGADHVIDYTQEDFTESGLRYDLILDNVANHSFAEYKRVLTTTGRVMPNSGHAGLGYILKAFARSTYARQQGRPYFADPNNQDLVLLKEFIEAGKLTPVIDRTYPLQEIAEGFRYLDLGHARGKVVITVGGD